MAKSTINTVVAKAIAKQLAHELEEARHKKTKVVEASIKASANYKKMMKLVAQIRKLEEQRNDLEKTIEGSRPDGYSVDVWTSGTVNVRPNSVRYDEALVVSDIIMLGHAGKTVEQIRTAIRTKYFS